MVTTRRQVIGEQAERMARTMLEAAGLVWVAGNVRYKVGELDLIMQDGPELVFVEVRSRRSAAFGGAAGSVDGRKRLRLQRAASRYLLEHYGHREWPPCRFYVFAWEDDRPDWIRAAFDGR